MKATKYIIAATAAIALAGCRSDEVRPAGFQSDPDAVHISATVGSTGTRSNPVGQTTFLNIGDRISIQTDDQSAVYILDTDNKWTPADPAAYLKWNKDAYTFMAYYPANAHFDGSDMFEVPTDQYTQDLLAEADYMKCETAREKTEGAVPLTLVRQTARIVVEEFVWQEQFDPTNCKIESVTISDGTTNVNAYIENDSKCYALLHPTDDIQTGNVFMVITVKDAVKNETTTLTISDIPKLEAGKSYSYRVILGKKEATVGNVTVENWETGSVIMDGGETTEVASVTT